MRASQFLLSTLKETPADAEVVSHQLMLRAGLIRRVAAGIYTWMPLGLRVLRKVENIVREEMDRAGALELSMPIVQPAELWEESGRWSKYGPELCRLQDRHQRDFCLGPTHEEIITHIARNELRSYKQLPVCFYQIQTKFRDEIRPRFGVMRAREFLMKDAYSFHVDNDSLSETYWRMHEAYCRMFTRLGLDYRPVEADTGAIGGSHSHEFQVLANSGEDDIVFSDTSDYAANIELAPALPPEAPRSAPTQSLEKHQIPKGAGDELAGVLAVPTEHTVTTHFVLDGNDEVVVLVLRGDHQLNDIKATKALNVNAPLRMASETQIQDVTRAGAALAAPFGAAARILADHAAAQLSDFICAASEPGHYYSGVNWARDISDFETVDLRLVVAGDPSPCGSGRLEIRRGIEVGHIFQLGTEYSEAMNAVVLDEQGKSQSMGMGCYGIGVSRIVAAAIEQNHDQRGICWPRAMAPFDVALVPLNMAKSDAVATATQALYEQLQSAGFEVFMDDRNERPGVKFAEMELIGIPVRVVVGDRSLAEGQVEIASRSVGDNEKVPLANTIETVTRLLTC